MIKIPFGLVSVLVLAIASPARAQSTAEASHPTTHRHLGFMLRPHIGGGYLSATLPGISGDSRWSGAAAEVGVAVGAAVVENLLLGAELYVSAVSNPSVSGGGIVGATKDVTLGNVGIGPILTYYVMPLNAYVSLTPAITKITLSQGNTSSSTNWGWGGRAAIGKEWWGVADHWGFGAAAQFTYSSNSSDVPGTFTAWGAGLVFSVTWN